MAAIPLVTLNLGFPAPFAYFEDFDGAAGTEWSNPVVDVSPTGERFLGQFSSSAVMLTLGELPLHTQVTIEFDLYIIDGWNGEDDDTFTFRAGGQILKHTSFSNRDDRQAYPGDLPSRDYAAGTGASATDALGYPDHGGCGCPGDATYRLTFALNHSAPSIAFTFESSTTAIDETFGIDNVRVTVQ
jgi:hypothetical protein